MHVGSVAVFDAAGRRLRLRAAAPPGRGPDRLRAALPPAGPHRPRPAGQPGLGGRRALRPDLPRAPLGAAAAGLGRAAQRAGRPGAVPPAGPRPPAVGGLPGRGPGEGPLRAAHQDPPGDGRRRSARSTSPRSSWTPARRPRSRRPTPGSRPRSRPTPSWWSPRSPTRCAARAPRSRPSRVARTTCGPPLGRVLGQAGHLLSAAARTAARPAPTSPLNADIGEQRRWAMVATSLEDHRKVRAQHSRRGSRELTVNDVVLATVAGALRAWLLTRGEPVVPATVVRALVPVSVHADEDEHDPARGQPGQGVRGRPAGRRAEPGRPAAPDRLLDAGPGRGRRRGQRGHPGRHRRLRAADAALARRPGGQRRLAPGVQPDGHQRARPAAPAVRRGRADAGQLPGDAAGQAPGGEHRADLLRRRRLLRRERRPERHAGRRRAGPVPGRGAGRAAGDRPDERPATGAGARRRRRARRRLDGRRAQRAGGSTWTPTCASATRSSGRRPARWSAPCWPAG